MPTDALGRALALIESEPHSAASLTLYALVNTLEHERAGCLFKLTKLRDLDQSSREVAYGLMELMAASGNQGDLWEQAKVRMDELIRAG